MVGSDKENGRENRNYHIVYWGLYRGYIGVKQG